jgi:hypothetical protein
MKRKNILIFTLVCAIFSACDKKSVFDGTAIVTGYAYSVDSTISNVPQVLKKQVVYLNNRSCDTSTYIYQTTTDSNGYFTFPYLSNNSYTIFSNYFNKIKAFRGMDTVVLLKASVHKPISLFLYPNVQNELILQFKTKTGGSLSKLPFSIYTDSVMAMVDSTKYAFLNSKSDSTGKYRLFNINPTKYYVTSGLVVKPGDTLYVDTAITLGNIPLNSTIILYQK